MDIKSTDTALVITDPQNDVLSEKGVAWALVGKSIAANRTVEHIGQIVQGREGERLRRLHLTALLLPNDQGGVRAARSRR